MSLVNTVFLITYQYMVDLVDLVQNGAFSGTQCMKNITFVFAKALQLLDHD